MVKAYKSNNLDTATISHGFFTRVGGVSGGVYSGLNLGLGSSDDRDLVMQNRSLVCEYFEIASEQLLTLYQIHSNKVVVVESPWQLNALPKADAMVTKQKNIALGILTADCVPVLFADEQSGVIGAAHAGWKGALAGVLENTIANMIKLGAKRENITATIGPAIQQQSYEVGDEVREKFVNANKQLDEFFSINTKGNYQFNLTGLVAKLINDEKIESLNHINQDTYKNSSEFYSFRRATHQKESDYGRQISVICLKD